MGIIDDLDALRTEGSAAVEQAEDLAALDAVRVAYLGKKGSLTAVLRGLGALSSDERPAVGKASNEVRQALEAAIEARRSRLSAAALEARVTAEAVDVTLPARVRPLG